MKPGSGSEIREGSAAILIATDGRLIMQLRDNVPHIRDPGKISLFGGRREGDESFLDCIVREIHEEIGYYVPPARFERIACWFGPDYAVPDGTFHAELFIARAVPVERLTVTEGRLKIVSLDELKQIRDSLALPAQFAIETFLKVQRHQS